MGERTDIQWTDHSWNPWWGCLKVSPGCANCYAEAQANRFGHRGIWGPAKTATRRTFGEKHWAQPIEWNAEAERRGTRAKVFCASMSDVFEDHPIAEELRPRIWDLVRATPWLDWQLLTKRPERIGVNLPAGWGEGWPNVWLGTSVEDQQRANERIPALVQVPARVHFLSCEPLLGPIDFYAAGSQGGEDGDPFAFSALRGTDGVEPPIPGIDWVIIGGESGPRARPMELAWAEGIVADCGFAGVPVFVKQLGGRTSHHGRLEDLPENLRVRQFPGEVPA